MSKLEPKNREEAFCHQFADDVKLCLSMSQLIQPGRKDDINRFREFQAALDTLKTHIKSYEQLKYA